MTEICAICGKEFPFEFLERFCIPCGNKYQTMEKVDKPKFAEDWIDFQFRHLRIGVAHFFELSTDDQEAVRSFANHNLGTER